MEIWYPNDKKIFEGEESLNGENVIIQFDDFLLSIFKSYEGVIVDTYNKDGSELLDTSCVVKNDFIDEFAHRRNPDFCAKCGGECEYDDDGELIQ